MKCMVCGSRMEKTRGNYPYRALPGVVLANVEIWRCTQCDEEEVSIPNIEGLHKTIAAELVRRKEPFTGPMIRFLRKLLGWSGADLARRFGVTPETVSRWETGKKPMGPIAERLLRVCVATKAPIDDYDLEDLQHVAEDGAEPKALTLKTSRAGDWKVAA